MTVPLVDVRAQHHELAEEIERVALEVLRSGHYVGGPQVERFERAYARYLGVAHCVGVGNGTDAIELALRALGVSAGDEVVVPGNTFIATAEAVSRIGARPVPVDVDPRHLLIAPEAVTDALTARTTAVVPVHLYGQTAPMSALREAVAAAGIPLVEDAAQAQGARQSGRAAGSWGALAATSLYPGKNLGAPGDAGAVTTDDDALADRVRMLASHGSRRKYAHEVVGMNSRLDALSAAVLTVKLARLDEWNGRRRALAARYTGLLQDVAGVELPSTAPDNEDAWHLYVVRVDDRDRVRESLAEAGIEAGVHYPEPWYLSPAYADAGHRAGLCPVTEAAAGRILSLPIHPHLTHDQQDRVVTALAEAVRA